MDIYIKPRKKAVLAEVKAISFHDFAEVVAPKDVAEYVNSMELITPNPDDTGKNQKQCYSVSVTEIIKKINNKYPDYTINNVGEMDTFIEYYPHKKKDSILFTAAKVLFICLVLFVGSGVAIMSFYSDAQMGEVFKNTHKLVFGLKSENPIAMEVSYSVGLASGIILFFNHFLGKKITNDPTPIEVEISKYETDVSDTMIDILETRKTSKKEGNI